MSTDDIDVYILAQFVDYGYMFCYGIFILMLGVFIGRQFLQGSKTRPQFLLPFGWPSFFPLAFAATKPCFVRIEMYSRSASAK